MLKNRVPLSKLVLDSCSPVRHTVDGAATLAITKKKVYVYVPSVRC